MSSERRIQASRANGAKSKGPKTPEGKARSSQNGVCHGLLANSLVLEEESKDIFTALHAEFVDEFAPSSPFESTLVGLMVAARWRCLRIWGMETSALDREMRNLAAGGAPQSGPEVLDASTAPPSPSSPWAAQPLPKASSAAMRRISNVNSRAPSIFW